VAEYVAHGSFVKYLPYQTCHRRFRQWVRSGIFECILQTLATDLRDKDEFDLSECLIDGTFAIAKKGATRLERPSGANRIGPIGRLPKRRMGIRYVATSVAGR